MIAELILAPTGLTSGYRLRDLTPTDCEAIYYSALGLEFCPEKVGH